MRHAWLFLILVGCSGADGSDLFSSPSTSSATSGSLFDEKPTSTVTPDSVLGLWGGMTELNAGTKIDLRMRLGATSLSNSLRCTLLSNGHESGVIGISIAARNSNTELDMLESKSDSFDDGTIKCSTSISPQELKACDDAESLPSNCFTLSGTELTLYGGTSLEKVTLTKLSD